MKDAKKSSIKKLKKNTKQIIEKDLSDKLHTFIKSLGHDVEDIGLELKKASKILAKKLVKKFGDVKAAVSDKTQSLKVNKPKLVKKAKSEIKKDVKKVLNKTKSVLAKAKPIEIASKIKPLVVIAKKEISLAKPVVAAIKKEIGNTKPAVTAVKKQISRAKPVVAAVEKEVSKTPDVKSVAKSVIKKADTEKKQL